MHVGHYDWPQARSGQGYGRDAVRLLLDYAFRLRNQHRADLSVNGNNERAIRAYKACGFIEEGRSRAHSGATATLTWFTWASYVWNGIIHRATESCKRT